MFGVAPRSSRISLKVPFSSGLSANTRHTSPLLMAGQILAVARGQRQHGLPGASRRPAAAAAGGAVAIDGWRDGRLRQRCGGRTGPDPGPDGGARFIAGPVARVRNRGRRHRRRPVGEHLGRDGGRHQSRPALWQAPAPGGAARPARARRCRHPSNPWRMLFTENAANSSLRDPGSHPVFWNPGNASDLDYGSRGPVILPACAASGHKPCICADVAASRERT